MAATADTQKKNVGRIEEIQGVVIEAVFPERAARDLLGDHG